jgi:general secretion pathway protein F
MEGSGTELDANPGAPRWSRKRSSEETKPEAVKNGMITLREAVQKVWQGLTLKVIRCDECSLQVPPLNRQEDRERNHQADAETSARSGNQERGLYLVFLWGFGGKIGKEKLSFLRHQAKAPSTADSWPLNGVPLFQALSIISNQLDVEKEREVVSYLRDQVRGGSSLSDALKAYPGIFDRLFAYSVQAGEKAGALDSVLAYQADLLENRAAIRGEIRAALTYPVIMIVVGTGVLLFLISYVVPMVMKIFDRMNQKLPAVTQILLSVTDFVNSYFVIMLVLAAACAIGLVQWVKRSARGRTTWDTFLLKVPLYGQLYQMILITDLQRCGTL